MAISILPWIGRGGRAGDDSGDPALYVLRIRRCEEARELTDCDKIKPLIADLDRVWGSRVSRRREILEIVQEIVS